MFHLDNAGSQINSRWTEFSVLSLVGFFQKGIFPGEPPISFLVIPRAVYFFNWHGTHWVWITVQGGGWCHKKAPGTLGITSWHFRTCPSGTGRDLGLIPGFDVTAEKPLNPLLPFFPCWNNGNSMQEYPGRLISLTSWDNQCPEIISWVSAEEEGTLLSLIVLQSFTGHMKGIIWLPGLLQGDEGFLLIISSLSPHQN